MGTKYTITQSGGGKYGVSSIFVKRPNIDLFFAEHAAAHLDLTTPFPTSDEIVHPSVKDMYLEKGAAWNGYRYWMAATPLPIEDPAAAENPCAYASHDMQTWVEPGINPIEPEPESGYNSDTDLYFDYDTDTLYCFYRAEGKNIYYNKSTDGINWSEKVLWYHADNNAENFSPSIALVNGKIRMYGVRAYNYNTDDVSSKITYLERDTIEGGEWAEYVYTNLDFSNTIWEYWKDAKPYFYIWHISVTKFRDVYYFILYIRSIHTKEESICLAESNDGLTITPAKYPMFVHYDNDAALWDTAFYRSCVVPYIDVDEIKFHLFYSGWVAHKDQHPVYIGRTILQEVDPGHITIGNPNQLNSERATIFTSANALEDGYVFADDFDRADVSGGVGTASCGEEWATTINMDLVDGYAVKNDSYGNLPKNIGVTEFEVSFDAILNTGHFALFPKMTGGTQFLKILEQDNYRYLIYNDVVNDPPNGTINIPTIETYARYNPTEINNFKFRITDEKFMYWVNNCLVIDYTFTDADFGGASNRAECQALTTFIIQLQGSLNDVKIKSVTVKEL